MKNITGNNNRIEPVLVTALFVFILFLPLLIMMETQREEISVNEKRKLAAFPEFQLNRESVVSFPQQFESYYQDHFGLRGTLITWNNKIKYYLFQKSPNPLVLSGKGGWLFYQTDTFGVSLADDYRGLKHLSRLQLETMKTSLETKRNWLAQRGIDYLYVVTPNKQSIYGEYMPNSLSKVHADTQLDQFIEYMHQRSDVPILDLRPVLRQAKNKGTLYFQTDSHWNDLGAFVAYQSLAERLKNRYPDKMDRLSIREVTQTRKNHVGRDLAKLIGIPDLVEKDVPTVLYPKACGTRNNQPSWAQSSWPWYVQPFETRCETGRLNALIFRDSFIDAMLPFVSKHFEKAAYIATKFDYAIATDLIPKIQPDIVIEEGIERHTFLAVLPDSIYATRGNDFLINGQLEKAVCAFQQALRIKPNAADNLNNLGFAYLKLRRFDEAIGLFKRAIAKDPNHFNARKNLTLATGISSKLDSQINATLKLLSTSGSRPALYFKLGKLYRKRGLPENAISSLEKALSLQPGNQQVLKEMAVLYATIQNNAKAISLFNQLITLNPQEPDTYYNLACLYARQNDIQKSIQWLQAALEKGYAKMDLITTDKDLENIRSTPYYRDLIRKHHNRKPL